MDVSRELTGWGQAWLLLLIQAGGLGILTLAGLLVSLSGVRMGLEVQEAAGGPTAILPPAAAARMLRTAVGFTFALEAAGVAALWLLWRTELGAAPAAWYALFHSISAFCNAGFSLFSDSLVGFRERPALILCVALLVVVGGLGFPVIQDLRYRLRGEHARLALHTRLVLGVTALLLAGSTLLYLVFEAGHELLNRAVVGDATDPALLERIAANEVDAAVIATGEDLSTTILAIMALRDLGVREIYAKAQSTNAVRALERLDVTEAVFPERDAGSRLAHRIVSRAVLDYTPIAEGFSMQEMAVPDEWTGRSLLEIEPRERLALQVVAVRDALTGAISLPPDPAVKLKPSDSLLVAGPDDTLEKLSARTRPARRSR